MSGTDREWLDDLRRLLGEPGVLCEPERMAPYLLDWRGLERGHCLAVLRPDTTAAVAETVRRCHERRVPITPLGGNTGLVGGGVPRGGVLISTERLNRIRVVDRGNAAMTLEAGCLLADAQAAAREQQLVFPLSLASEGSCRIGGCLATNAGGNQTVRFGNTRNQVLGLEVVLPDGRVWDGLRALRKDNTGYDLKQLFIGSEGTLGVITAAVFSLVPGADGRETALLACRSTAAVVALFQHLRDALGEQLLAYELMPRKAVELACMHIPGLRAPLLADWLVLVELTSPSGLPGLRDAFEQVLAEAMDAGLADDAVIAESLQQGQALWRIREGIPQAQTQLGALIKHDVSVPIPAIPRFLAEGHALLQAWVPDGVVLAFGHVGDGNIHFNLAQPPGSDPAAFLALAPDIHRAMHDLTASMAGSFSAEHGVGSAKRADMARYRSVVELDLMRAVKAAVDPLGLMNPGKLLP
jgi:FAD/FMN-containing dehydrogenase